MKKTITIGIAVFKVEKYVSECLDSIISLSGDDIEIIAVDDCSPDNAGKICDEYAEKDSRIRVIHFEKNSGICAVRNRIIIEAQGEWIYFIDGDDTVPPFFYDVAMQSVGTDYDVVYYDYKEFVHGTTFKNNYNNNAEKIELTKTDVEDFSLFCITGYKDLLPYNKKLKDVRVTSIWAKTYKVDFLRKNNLFFPENQVKSQDLVFNSSTYHYARKACYIPQQMYNYRVNPDSICNKYNSNIVKINDSLLKFALNDISRYYGNREDILKAFYSYRVINVMFVCMQLDFMHKDNKSPKEQIKSEFTAFINSEPYKTALNSIDINNYWYERQYMLKKTMQGNYNALKRAYDNPFILKFYGGLKNRLSKFSKK